MTIDEAVTEFDLIYPNALAFEEKVRLLSRLDKRVFEDVFANYDDCPAESFDGYTRCTPGTTELLIPFPHDGIYIRYLAAETDLMNSDIGRYNNSAVVFNSAYAAFRNTYNRTHRWKKTVRIGDVT